MNFYDYWTPDEGGIDNPPLSAALDLITMGFKILPCENKVPIDKIKSVNKLRVTPIHDKNVDFYFSDPVDIGILTGDTLEVIDIDSKRDLTGSLYKTLLRAIKYTLPDIYDSIVIQSTVNGGYHLFYRCSQIAGPLILARRRGEPNELAKGQRRLTLIETRGEGNYVMVSPTPGYNFIKGNPSVISTISPEDRAILIAICRSFNRFEDKKLSEVSKSENERPDAPWNVFNTKNGYQWTVDVLAKAGWEIGRDDMDKIFVLRPGAMSKTSGVIWKESSILYLFSTSTEFVPEKGYTPFGVLTQLSYGGDFKAAARDLSEQGIGSWSYDDGEFYSTGKDGKVKPKLRAIIDWLNEIGIRKYYLNHIDFEFVHVINNRVKVIDVPHIKKLFCDYILSTCIPRIDEYFLSHFTGIFNREGIVNFIDVVSINHFIKPVEKNCFLLFKNTAVLVSAQDCKYIPYSELPGLVWEDNVISREISSSPTDCDISRFILNICSGNDDRVKMCKSAIGYLLHPFKDPADPKVIVLTDEAFKEGKEDEPQGGTGKGIFIKMLSHFRSSVSIDGKSFNFAKSFLYQRVSMDTQLVAFEDVAKGFDFEKLFSIITDGWVVEKKGKDEFIIPFERSPKILITSNYAIKGSSASHSRRRYEIEASAHYSHDNSIRKEFGHLFFIDWDAIEWNRFDNLMLDCIQFYFINGFAEQTYVNMTRKRLFVDTTADFVDWIDNAFKEKILVSGKVPKAELMERFVSTYPDYRKKLTQTTFTRWVRKWIDSNGFWVDSRNNFNGIMMYHFKLDADWIQDSTALDDLALDQQSACDFEEAPF